MKKCFLIVVVVVSVFLLSCADTERNNPYDERAVNYIGKSSAESSSSSSSVPSSSSYSGEMCLWNEFGDCWPLSAAERTHCKGNAWIFDGGKEGEGTMCRGGTFTGEGKNNTPPGSSIAPSSSSTAPSSSSAVPSSSSALPSSSSVAPSSSSVAPSSSSASPSSSSTAPSSSSYGGLCAGFDGAKRLHYEREKEQFCDERDGKKYVYVVIGTQTWMAENLNYAASGSKCGDDDRSFSDNNTAYCDTYGRLYNWSTAMNNSASSSTNPSRVQGVCPSGWHIPSDAEWSRLETTVGGSSTAGAKLKAQSGWNDYEGKSGNGTDDYGFSALPGNNGASSGVFFGVGDGGNWWSATEYNDIHAHIRIMNYSYGSVKSGGYPKSNPFSVRCVRD